MKNVISLILSLIITVSFTQLHAARGELKPYTGKLTNPDFTLTDLQGKQYQLSDYRGNIVLVQFWATYCTPCRKEMPTMNRLIQKMQDKPFKIVTINMAEPQDAVEQFTKEVEIDFPVLMDENGSTISQWKVFAAPANFIIDKQGKIIYTLFGAIDWDSDKMVAKLSELAGS